MAANYGEWPNFFAYLLPIHSTLDMSFAGCEIVRFLAHSPCFELVEDGYKIPEYRVITDAETGVTDFEKVDK